MGQALSMIKHPFRNFNIESKAHKFISKENKSVAPKHQKDQISYEMMMKDYPEVFKDSQKKNKQLDGYLKDVYVQSRNVLQEKKIEDDPSKPLPSDRTRVDDFEYGIKEPKNIPVGKSTLRQVLQFVTDHQANAKVNSVQKISKDYSLPEESVGNILKYFKVYEVYIPDRMVKAKFAGPTVSRIRITPNPRKQLSAGNTGKNET